MRIKNRIYLDYAATTPIDLEVERSMNPFFSKIFGNPGSIHRFGQEASAAVFEARQKIAKSIGAKYNEIVFTGSATEANNLALRGTVKSLILNLSQLKIKDQRLRIIISAIEHESILETASDLEKEGVEIIYIPVSKEGIVNIKKIKEALNDRTVLVSIMYANNEIGTIQPISKIYNLIKDFRDSRFKIQDSGFSNIYPLFHTDAVQAFQFLNCNINDLGVDLMTLSAHKIYGPKGIGALYVRQIKDLRFKIQDKKFMNHESIFLNPIITGGGQEWGLRSGTENVLYIVGFGAAVQITDSLKFKEFKRLKSLRDYFWSELKKFFPKAQLNGSVADRLPNNLNIYFPGSSAQDRCIELDLLGIAVSPGVACSVRSAKPSYTIEALGFSKDRVSSSLRFSFGRYTTRGEINRGLKLIKELGN